MRIRDQYLNLLEKSLLDIIYSPQVSESQSWDAERAGQQASEAEIEEGKYWPARAHTMIGRKRLRNLRDALEVVLTEGVPGDFMETGVWRGGASIYAKGVLEAHGDSSRKVILADSFCGLPKPDPQYSADQGDAHWEVDFLRVSKDTVARNFDAYDLLDERVIFIEGFFEDTLHKADIGELAVLRLDGDMYSSTIQALDALYAKVVDGGFILVDDYALPNCQAAIDDFRAEHGIECPLVTVDWTGVYWRKQ